MPSRPTPSKKPLRTTQIPTVFSLNVRETILHSVSTQQARHHDTYLNNTINASNVFTLPNYPTSLFEKKPSYKEALYYSHPLENLKRQTPLEFKEQLTLWLQDMFYS